MSQVKWKFIPNFHFYTLWKYENTKGFLTFFAGVEIVYLAKMGYINT